VVNRVFPPEVEGTYFGPWRERQAEHLELVESAFSPVPVLRAPYFEAEVVGPAMLDRLADALFADGDAAALLHTSLSQELVVGRHSARLRLDLPFADRGDVSLKKIGLELVVRVDGQKRTIMLPPGLARFRPREAKLDAGTLEVRFEELDA
jgi:arsenite/tail-anchored protein-transporting ATPase